MLGSHQVPTLNSLPGDELVVAKSIPGHTWGGEGCACVCNVKNRAPLQNHQVLKSTSVSNKPAAEATWVSWQFLGNCKEREQEAEEEEIPRFMFQSSPSGTGGGADGLAALLSLSCTLDRCSAPKKRKTFLGCSSSFSETSKWCQWLNTTRLCL